MSWRLAESLITLRDQVNERWPTRDKTSDGSIGDQSHAARKSDHNPNSHGVVTAIDIDRELGGQPDGSNAGDTVGVLVSALRASKDPRIKYIIWQGQITMPGDLSRLKPYHGPNGHFHHAHISVSSDPKLYDNAADWNLNGATSVLDVPVTLPVTHPTVKYGVKGQSVRDLQNALVEHGFITKIDGDFGRSTEKALREFQHAKGLTEDAIAGPDTWRALGL